MARLIIETDSLRKAKVLAEWYEGQGEQDAQYWLEELGINNGAYVDREHGIKIDTVEQEVTIKVN